MSQPSAIILRTAGTNCDEETAYAWELAGAKAARIHVQRVIDSPLILDQFDALTIPGGFSYGDYLRCGAMAGCAPIMGATPARRVRSLWMLTCMGQLCVMLLAQIACYYYSFLVLSAPLTRARRDKHLARFHLDTSVFCRTHAFVYKNYILYNYI